MPSPYKLGIFGGDLRQVYMAEAFIQMGYKITIYGLSENVKKDNCYTASSIKELFILSNVLIGPIPMSRDMTSITSKEAFSDLTINNIISLLDSHHTLIGGNIPSTLTDICTKKKISYFDYMKSDKIAVKNGIATAEGAIMEAISSSDINLHHSNCLVLGYGRCAKILAQKLQGLNAFVTVAARSEDALAYAEAAGHGSILLNNIKDRISSFDYIFNTIPSKILDSNILKMVNPHVTIIDIASAPGGIDYEYTKNHNINALLFLGIPGKVAPRSSANILVTETLAYLYERSD